jgi:DNA-binding SARP family transcriptional activator
LLLVELRLLGPVELEVASGVLDAGPPQQRVVLAALAAEAGRIVTLPDLVDRVWGDAPPSAARQALYTHIARIRQLLVRAGAGDILVRRSAGYALRLDRDRIDVHRFVRLVGQARAGRYADEERAALLREALALWRQEPLAGLPGLWADQMRTRWRRHRVEAVVAWADAELRLGNVAALVGPLAEMATEQPLVEPLVAVLLRALHAAGHTAEALDWYDATRKRLADELGTDPGPELQRLHQTILRGESPAPATVTPALLPPDVYGFVGRDDHLARLNAILAGTDQPTVVVSGTAGVGKPNPGFGHTFCAGSP